MEQLKEETFYLYSFGVECQSQNAAALILVPLSFSFSFLFSVGLISGAFEVLLRRQKTINFSWLYFASIVGIAHGESYDCSLEIPVVNTIFNFGEGNEY